jgi:hypothetical protein
MAHQVFGIDRRHRGAAATRVADHQGAAEPSRRGALVGVFISIGLELCGIRSLSFAVGSYLPIATTAPIFVGGLVRGYVERKTGTRDESEVSAGTLFSSGLIAGGSLCGILYAVLVGTKRINGPQALGNMLPFLHDGLSGYIASAILFVVLAGVLARQAQKKVM